jgi:hypothetical protein
VDERTRNRLREAQASNDPTDQAAVYTEMMRRGFPPDRISLLAFAGDEGARLALAWRRAGESQPPKDAPKDAPGGELYDTPNGRIEVPRWIQGWDRGIMTMLLPIKATPAEEAVRYGLATVLPMVTTSALAVCDLLATSKAPSPVQPNDARAEKALRATRAWLANPVDETLTNAARDAGLALDDLGGFPGVVAETALGVRCNLPQCYVRVPTQHFENVVDLASRVYAHDVQREPAVVAVKKAAREALTPLVLDDARVFSIVLPKPLPAEAAKA